MVVIVASISGLLSCNQLYAQKATAKNYKSNTEHIKSMYGVYWKFHPGVYFLITHKKYSGAHGNIFNPKFSVEKSTTGWISEPRLEAVAMEEFSAAHIQQEIDSVAPIAVEETVRTAERMIDVHYANYSSKFKRCFDNIDETLTKAILKGSNKYYDYIAQLQDERDLIKSEIDYIHEQGPEAQMEQAKRQLAYEEAEKRLEILQRNCAILYRNICLQNKRLF